MVSVSASEEVSDSFAVTNGIKQDYDYAPILFSFYTFTKLETACKTHNASKHLVLTVRGSFYK